MLCLPKSFDCGTLFIHVTSGPRVSYILENNGLVQTLHFMEPRLVK